MRKVMTWLLLNGHAPPPARDGSDLTVYSWPATMMQPSTMTGHHYFFQRMRTKGFALHVQPLGRERMGSGQAEHDRRRGRAARGAVSGCLSTRSTADVEKGVLIDLKALSEEYAPTVAMLQEHPDWLRPYLPTGHCGACRHQSAAEQQRHVITPPVETLGLSELAPPGVTEVLRAFKTRIPTATAKRRKSPGFCSLWDLRFLGHASGWWPI